MLAGTIWPRRGRPQAILQRWHIQLERGAENKSFCRLFSIIIPAYKAQHLRQAIQSVLAQSCGDYELLVVDDYSPHELKTELTDFHDHRIYYHRTPHNLGGEDPSRTWNYALQLAKGELIILLERYELRQLLEEMKRRLCDRHPAA